ncbi:hypothetical protein Pmani_034499 [Petrolisthes manimaculis]|uniref:Uncharacterized protein n=1 Tax=Petrolisthes manimaculis TaxID=1843537 RepID=A0AAE1NNF1_9EUCA|nr:hypothetical protein Pmani_034499 [Petrolisthes manimaculis]
MFKTKGRKRVADSQTTLTEEEEAAEAAAAARRQREDRARLVAQQENQEGALSLSEVHEHLIRSPPPTTLPRTLPSVFFFPHDKNQSEGGSAAPASGGRSGQPLKPLVTRQHADVLDHHLRQILHTQRQLVVPKSRTGEGGVGCSSVPASPARNLNRRSPHSRTLSEEATLVQDTGGSAGTSVGVSTGGAGMNIGINENYWSGGGSGGSLAPVLPPGRRQHSSTDILLHPTDPPTASTAPTPTPTPPILKPIMSTTSSTPTPTPPILKPIMSTTSSTPTPTPAILKPISSKPKRGEVPVLLPACPNSLITHASMRIHTHSSNIRLASPLDEHYFFFFIA